MVMHSSSATNRRPHDDHIIDMDWDSDSIDEVNPLSFWDTVTSVGAPRPKTTESFRHKVVPLKSAEQEDYILLGKLRHAADRVVKAGKHLTKNGVSDHQSAVLAQSIQLLETILNQPKAPTVVTERSKATMQPYVAEKSEQLTCNLTTMEASLEPMMKFILGTDTTKKFSVQELTDAFKTQKVLFDNLVDTRTLLEKPVLRKLNDLEEKMDDYIDHPVLEAHYQSVENFTGLHRNKIDLAESKRKEHYEDRRQRHNVLTKHWASSAFLIEKVGLELDTISSYINIMSKTLDYLQQYRDLETRRVAQKRELESAKSVGERKALVIPAQKNYDKMKKEFLELSECATSLIEQGIYTEMEKLLTHKPVAHQEVKKLKLSGDVEKFVNNLAEFTDYSCQKQLHALLSAQWKRVCEEDLALCGKLNFLHYIVYVNNGIVPYETGSSFWCDKDVESVLQSKLAEHPKK